MKFFCRTFCALFVAACAVHAASPDDEDAATFGDYAPTLDDDLVIYVPKYTVRLGFRAISGVKSSFSGSGVLSSFDDIGDATGVRGRLYHDGYVAPDSRTITDPAGNPVPIAPDGRTNSWKITDAAQVDDASGVINMHTYKATTDGSAHENDPGMGYGVELALERDFGKLLGTRLQWGVIGGFSVNQFLSAASSKVAAQVTTTTDRYSLYGQTIIDPSAGYTAPGASGADTTILLGNEIVGGRLTNISAAADAVTSSWKLRGAYMTFRAGPTLFLPIGSRFSATFSAGAVVVYAGSSYEVNQSFKPETGDTITQSTTGLKGTLLPGYYVDASLQLSINDTSGLYIGAVYQSSGNYTQSITSDDEKSTYLGKVDLSSLQGIRAGVNFRF